MKSGRAGRGTRGWLWVRTTVGNQMERQKRARLWRRYLLLAISHGSISIKFITAFPANIARRSYYYISPPFLLLRIDRSSRCSCFIFSSIRFIFLSLRDITYYDPSFPLRSANYFQRRVWQFISRAAAPSLE